ncbi:MAG: tyrosine-type recombinase/integrase [Actinobacteria bacterium]|nr:tyrosine-type recombinase/integrase [Actinomycetota bacterium]
MRPACVFDGQAPTRPIRADLVGDVVQRACLHAAIGHVAAHRLRHTFASELLRHGASIVDISQLLLPQRSGHHGQLRQGRCRPPAAGRAAVARATR